ncbi:SDR family NAD(P)-dependent oxidoreductase [Janibacter limosus]|jgi:NAD(P)-dependent dehydrogenase (short-subunit alcohol dehydrogenase family)|uniref:SDR family NAD(P)-dependent oxidoreductase n=1 Tax=Janibacter limosus TaxID=53458 RepID=UPI000A076505|nr:SDR family oxidoreductase [Janibacter limosus]
MTPRPTRVALVTGARRGIGAATVTALAEAGLQVVAAVRSPTSTPGADLTITGDVTDAGDVHRMLAEVADRLGPVDVLVNNAGGFLRPGTTLDTTKEEWEQQLALNLTAPFVMTQAVLPGMIARGWGRIVTIGSVVARAPALGNATAYVAAKAGVVGWTRQLALETAGTGVTANVVNPGTTRTEHLDDYLRDSDRAGADLAASIPMGRLGDPAEVAAAVRYLVGEDAGFTTGISIDVNGGVAMS